MKTEVFGWGRFPVIQANKVSPVSISNIRSQLTDDAVVPTIARGMGRSYGDSSLAEKIIDTRYLNHMIEFNSNTGKLTCFAGAIISDILSVFVPKGWFLPVTPGTKFVTIGGAIASDVHGKNHHVDGSFCDHIESFRIMLANREVVNCSEKENSNLFQATCGGMGLTGIIIDATFYLKKVGSAYIKETAIRTKNLTESLDLFNEYNGKAYSVAWIDCLASGKNLGRSILMLGEHSNNGRFYKSPRKPVSIPVYFPGFILNQYSVSAFNSIYYHKKDSSYSKTVHYDSFFYPLDSLIGWNKIYGSQGFTQYQFVIPKTAGEEGIRAVLSKISKSRRGSFLAVLKALGKSNNNYLSFPIEGYTLALDFKLEPGIFKLLDYLDQIVLDYNGRVYLAKDARMSEDIFKKTYRKWDKFVSVRKQYQADKVFNSYQSRRLGI